MRSQVRDLTVVVVFIRCLLCNGPVLTAEKVNLDILTEVSRG
jgi:hypothetical protein